jgi:hypothetical protein
MQGEYDSIEELEEQIAALRSKIAELEATERDRKQTKEAVRKIEEHFRFNGVSRIGTPSFFWFRPF